MKRNVRLLLYLPMVFLLVACENSLSSNSNKPLKDRITFKETSIIRADSANIPAKVRKRYRLDAEVITAVRINRKDSTQIELPRKLIDLFYQVLLHIYNSNSKEAKVVAKKYEIHHAVKNGLSRKLLVTIDSAKSWKKAWENGELFTGKNKIDELLKKYHLALDKFSLLKSFPWDMATFHSAKPLNQIALADLFESLKSIRSAEPNINFIDGNNIKANIKQNYINYIFSRGFGDCPSGCAHEYWSFNVYSDGHVEFVKYSG